jgi:hypothetical protein
MKEGRKKKKSMQRHWRSWQVQRIPDEKEKTCTPKSETHATSRLLHRPVTKEENSPLFRNQRLSLSLSFSLSPSPVSSVILSKVHRRVHRLAHPTSRLSESGSALFLFISLCFFGTFCAPTHRSCGSLLSLCQSPKILSSLALSVRDTERQRKTTERCTHRTCLPS